MPNYDREVVLAMLQGNTGDAVVKDAAKHIKEKHVDPNALLTFYESDVVNHQDSNLMFKLEDTNGVINNLTKDSRLYIVGHGVSSGEKVGGLTGVEMANTLVSDGNMGKIKRISVVSCYGGGNQSDLLDFENSFAENLLKELFRLHKAPLDVTARVGLVRVDSTGKKTVDGFHQEKDKVLVLTIDTNGKITKTSKY